jgi:hypothetical protein
METLTMIRQTLGEENKSCTQEVQPSRDQKGETGEEQSKEHARHFL